MTANIRAADALAQRLYAAGCRVAFGMPGGEVLTIIDTLAAADIQFVRTKHENAAHSWPKVRGIAPVPRAF